MLNAIQTGCLVRSKRAGAGFRQGAVFRVVSIIAESSQLSWVACRALAETRCHIRYLRVPDLEVVGEPRMLSA